jgi:hypothetical protein
MDSLEEKYKDKGERNEVGNTGATADVIAVADAAAKDVRCDCIAVDLGAALSLNAGNNFGSKANACITSVCSK